MVVSDFQQQALRLSQQLPASTLLTAVRDRGAQAFADASWPSRKTEQWKYTSLLSLQDFSKAHFPSAQSPTHADVAADIPALDGATRLVFVDGQLDVMHSDALPAGVCLFSAAQGEAAVQLNKHLGNIALVDDKKRNNIFSDLNDAWLSDGLLVHVPRQVELEKPLYLVFVSSCPQSAVVSNQRVLIVVDDGASAQIIEHYASGQSECAVMVNAVTEIHVGENARLHHTRLNLEHESVVHVGGVYANLQRCATLDGFALAEGSRLKRIDYQINHCGQGASLNLNGIYLARNSQLVDYHTCIEHRVPHCTSQEVFRGIVGDKARAVFNGRIHIHQDAQKTLAELSNRNLLTSDSAEIDTKPELEIYADDVRCAHGATISQLDETALYYLQSRGIEMPRARMMLSYGFINEVLEALPYERLREALQTTLRQRFIEEGQRV